MKKNPNKQKTYAWLMKGLVCPFFFLIPLISFANSLPSAGHGVLQRKISINIENAEVKTVLKKIEETGSVRFVYQPQAVNTARAVSLAVEEMPIGHVLNMLFDGGASYEEMGDLVVIKPVNRSVVAPSSVSGKITDAKTGEPLFGVNVAEKGTPNGTTTDEDGKYALTVNDSKEAVLVFSFVGYASQEISVASQSVIDIELVADEKGLEEVVVVGYGSQQKNLLASSIVSMKMDDTRRNTPTTSAGNLLAGQMAGVNVGTPGGIPGTQPSISIRTGSSFNPQNVLYVIDGKISGAGDFNNLSPNDIDNVSVLKDAASAAAYGARAAGGVIVVTTRRGVKGKTSVNYSYNTGVDVKAKNAPLTSAIETGEIYNRINPTAPDIWTQSDFDYFKNINGGWGYDQLEAVWENPYTSTHNLSVSGGSNKVTYFAGGSYAKQGGFMKNLTFDKYNFRANITADLTKNLNLFAGVTLNNNLSYTPTNTAVGDVAGIYRKQLLWQPEQPVWTDGGNPIDYGWIGNVGAEVRGDGGYITKNDIKPVINLKAVYKIPVVPGLSASVQYNKSYSNSRSKQFQKRYDMWVMKKLGSSRQISTKDADLVTPKKSTQIGKDFISETHSWSNDYQLNFQVNYERTFAKVHHINGWGVYEQAGSNDGGITGGRETFPVYTTDQWWAASGDRLDDYARGNTVNTYARQSWVGQMFYDYDQKYIVGFTCRYDGSPKFPKEKRWGLFPSASAGWVISRENFFKVKAIHFLKIRASSGLTSADNIDNWQWQQSYVGGSSSFFGTNTATNVGITYGGITNPNVTWEKTLNSNIAIDIDFWDHFSATAEYYHIKTYDILGQRIATVPPTFPRSLPSANYGEIRAGGIDFSLGYKNHKEGLNYYANMNLNYGGAKYVTIDENVTFPWQKKTGASLSRIATRVNTGMIRTQTELDAFKAANPKYNYYGVAPALGQLTYEDISGDEGKPDGKIDNWDIKTIYENNNPVNLGLNLGASWKGFSLDATFSGRLFQKSYMNSLAGGVEWNRMWKNWYTDGWTPENTNASLPKRYSSNDGAKGVTNDGSTFWLKDSGFLRLRLLNVGYNIPADYLKKTGIAGIKIYFSGTNLFMFSKFNKLYYDSELGDPFLYPAMKNFNIGINVSL